MATLEQLVAISQSAADAAVAAKTSADAAKASSDALAASTTAEIARVEAAIAALKGLTGIDPAAVDPVVAQLQSVVDNLTAAKAQVDVVSGQDATSASALNAEQSIIVTQ